MAVFRVVAGPAAVLTVVLFVGGCADSRTEATDSEGAGGPAVETPEGAALPTVSPEDLEVGTRYRFPRATPLVAELDPGDPAMAMAEPILLADASNVTVLERVEAAGTVWYRVEAKDGVSGWVSIEALRGRDVLLLP